MSAPLALMDLELRQSGPALRAGGGNRSEYVAGVSVEPLTATRGRDLGRADMELLARAATTRRHGEGGSVPPLAAIRASHHKLAQHLAHGATSEEAALATGYAVETVARLRSDPTFKELIAHYEGQARELFIDVLERSKFAGLVALEVLQERITERPETVSSAVLLDTFKTAIDRAGFAPTQRVESLHAHVDLAELKAAARARQQGRVVEGRAEPPPGGAAPSERSPIAPVGLTEESNARAATGTAAQGTNPAHLPALSRPAGDPGAAAGGAEPHGTGLGPPAAEGRTSAGDDA